MERHVGIDVKSHSKPWRWAFAILAACIDVNLPVVLICATCLPWQRQVAQDKLPHGELDCFGLLVTTSGGERQKAPLLWSPTYPNGK